MPTRAARLCSSRAPARISEPEAVLAPEPALAAATTLEPEAAPVVGSTTGVHVANSSDWKTSGLPAKRATVQLDRLFTPKEMVCIRHGLVPQQMEDKWFVYWEGQTLFFHRSWTGHCIYTAHFEPREGGNWQCTEFDVNRELEQYGETCDDADAKQLSFLIDVLLLRRLSSFPIADDDDTGVAALQAWSLVGRAMLDKHPGDK